jgi:putative addiction module component (TIGR02574 family)
MSKLVKKFADEALLLPREDRVELVEELLQSLNSSYQKEIDDLWEAEVENRVREIEEGKVRTIDGEKVFKEISNKLKR